jgi:preprotein translocase subunit SecA
MPLLDPDRPEDLTPEQARLTGYLEQALRAQYLFHRNKDYLVQGGKVVIVDDSRGASCPADAGAMVCIRLWKPRKA